MCETAALLVAAGQGHRAGDGIPKVYRCVGGVAVLRHALQPFLSHPQVGEVRVVIQEDHRHLYEEATQGLSLSPPVIGGTTRQDSVRAGLESFIKKAPPTYILIHDAARPFLTPSLVSRCLKALEKYDGAVPTLPITDTLRHAPPQTPPKIVSRTHLYQSQTPQAFRFHKILQAHRKATSHHFTDDATLAEAQKLHITHVAGEISNIKLTHTEDFQAATVMTPSVRIGFGSDAHPFSQEKPLTLCGVKIPDHRGLEGHSDADPALHALTDALLGALGEGDIGTHFPPSEKAWKNAPSHLFVSHAMELLQKQGGRVMNADLTLICDTPRIVPLREAMCAVLEDLLGTKAVSIKATTTEGFGLSGKTGIVAQAVVCIQLGHPL